MLISAQKPSMIPFGWPFGTGLIYFNHPIFVQAAPSKSALVAIWRVFLGSRSSVSYRPPSLPPSFTGARLARPTSLSPQSRRLPCASNVTRAASPPEFPTVRVCPELHFQGCAGKRHGSKGGCVGTAEDIIVYQDQPAKPPVLF